LRHDAAIIAAPPLRAAPPAIFRWLLAFIFIITPLFSRWLPLRFHDDIFFLCHFSLFSDAYAYAIMPLTPPPCILRVFFYFADAHAAILSPLFFDASTALRHFFIFPLPLFRH
jgi:hypothetical protein